MAGHSRGWDPGLSHVSHDALREVTWLTQVDLEISAMDAPPFASKQGWAAGSTRLFSAPCPPLPAQGPRCQPPTSPAGTRGPLTRCSLPDPPSLRAPVLPASPPAPPPTAEPSAECSSEAASSRKPAWHVPCRPRHVRCSCPGLAPARVQGLCVSGPLQHLARSLAGRAAGNTVG